MKQYFVVAFLLKTIFIFGQTKIDDLNLLFRSLDTKDFKVVVSQDERELHIGYYQNENLTKNYKLVIEKIHSKGIFLWEENDSLSITILSLCDHNVFVEEKFVNDFRFSRTTNFVQIGRWHKEKNRKVINEIVKELKGLVIKMQKGKEKELQEIDINEPQIYIPKLKNGND